MAASGAPRHREVEKWTELASEQLPAAVLGESVKGAYFGKNLGCIQFWPTGELVLSALCPAS